ncbi:DUF5368 domain-containing protein [Martelella soudanensis]|uniref:DUF5368 domain-containing protein n=1 Tax=unclassified Martelella TaxID=2629616 RepID=UPI0015DFE385|nr:MULTISPECIES: DUF5368 domain-containing protein [unclassified Martelella]
MKDLTIGTMIAVFEEIFGRYVFWIMVALIVLVTLAYFYVLIRDRAVSWKKFLLAQLSMPVGAVAAVWLLMATTHSQLSDMGGPVDVLVLLGVALAGAIGMAICVYTIGSLIAGPRSRSGGQGPS